MGKSRRKFNNNYSNKFNFNISQIMKFIPILGLILLFGIYISQENNNIATNGQVIEDKPFMETLIDTGKDLANSFDFSNFLTLSITVILLITLWTGYKYWLKDMRYIRRNNQLLEKLLYVMMIIIL